MHLRLASLPYDYDALRIESDLGGYHAFAQQLAVAAIEQAGSGWAWLELEDDKLAITATANAETPLVLGQTPLRAIDVWEHAWYLDHQNRHADYVGGVIERLDNGKFANRNLVAATRRAGNDATSAA